MNIYAKNGDKVICKNISRGYDLTDETANKYLKIGSVYTVDYTDVHNWHTNVYLIEFPNVSFNSTDFEDYKN